MKQLDVKQSINNQSLGEKGEKFASDYLISRGYSILDKNFRTTIGEIDIIAENNGILCFIEVKSGTDNSTKYFLPEQRIDGKKRNRLRKLAEIYAKQNNINHENINHEKELRIDAISVIFRENKEPIIEHFENI